MFVFIRQWVPVHFPLQCRCRDAVCVALYIYISVYILTSSDEVFMFIRQWVPVHFPLQCRGRDAVYMAVNVDIGTYEFWWNVHVHQAVGARSFPTPVSGSGCRIHGSECRYRYLRVLMKCSCSSGSECPFISHSSVGVWMPSAWQCM